MEKVIRDGKVAVLYSPGYGGGWYTWNTEYPQILFHPKLVEKVESNKPHEINSDWCLKELGVKPFCGGASQLEIHWLPVGTHFDINEYDGYESIVTFDNIKFIA